MNTYPHVLNSADEHQTWAETTRQAAHRGLSTYQAHITYGSHWVQFVDIDSAIIQFGRVWTLAEVADSIETGRDHEDRATIQRITDDWANTRDLVFGSRHDRLRPSAALGYTHRSHIWPIEDRLFHMAQDVEFDYRKLGEVGRFLLDVAFRQMRAEVIG